MAGAYELILPEDPQIFAYLRKLGTETAVVMVNLSPHSAFYRHPAYPLSSAGLLTPATADFLDDAAL
ncbi:alpha-glucosidase C-terminal domain-containing protein [Bacillus sp. PM8313]|nr:alpha-glucosidase C-terminal domain-containing protein [Bacillus sp. PM8313]